MRSRELAVALLLAAAASPAGATDLINKDDAAYKIAVTAGVSTMKTSIAGKTVKQGVCAATAATCVIWVENVGEIEVTGADDVVIKNGRLSKQ